MRTALALVFLSAPLALGACGGSSTPSVEPSTPELPREKKRYPIPSKPNVRSVAATTSSAACRVNIARPLSDPMSGAYTP